MIKYLITLIFFALKSYGALEVTIAQGKVEANAYSHNTGIWR